MKTSTPTKPTNALRRFGAFMMDWLWRLDATLHAAEARAEGHALLTARVTALENRGTPT